MTSALTPSIIAHWEHLAGRPALTWYGADGERVELGGRILVNWVTKAANYIVGEAGQSQGAVIGLDLPPHWRTCVWTWAAWWVGVGVDVVSPGQTELSDDDIEVVVTDSPQNWDTATLDVVAVALPALARSFPGDLPPHAIDAGPAVMGQADAPLFIPPAPADEVAVSDPAVSFADLAAWCGDLADYPLQIAKDLPEGQELRVLIHVSTGGSRFDVLRATAAVWRAGGSVVACLTDDPDSPVNDAERYARLLEAERVTHELSLNETLGKLATSD